MKNAHAISNYKRKNHLIAVSEQKHQFIVPANYASWFPNFSTRWSISHAKAVFWVSLSQSFDPILTWCRPFPLLHTYVNLTKVYYWILCSCEQKICLIVQKITRGYATCDFLAREVIIFVCHSFWGYLCYIFWILQHFQLKTEVQIGLISHLELRQLSHITTCLAGPGLM